MRSIENHRPAAIGHDFQPSHIDNQVVIAEGRNPAFREHDLRSFPVEAILSAAW